MLLLLTTNTYNADNDWGGPNPYTGGIRVSFRRPFAPGLLKKPRPEVRYPNVDAWECETLWRPSSRAAATSRSSLV